MTFVNTGQTENRARLGMSYSSDSSRSRNTFSGKTLQNDYLIPAGRMDKLDLKDDTIRSTCKGRTAVRCVFATGMESESRRGAVVFTRNLEPGGSCDLLLKIPFLNPDSKMS